MQYSSKFDRCIVCIIFLGPSSRIQPVKKVMSTIELEQMLFRSHTSWLRIRACFPGDRTQRIFPTVSRLSLVCKILDSRSIDTGTYLNTNER